MKKTLIITLTDGRIIYRDLTLEKILDVDGKTPIPIGSPANHPGYAMLVRYMAGGFVDMENTTEKELVWIPSGDIKSVKVKFGELK